MKLASTVGSSSSVDPDRIRKKFKMSRSATAPKTLAVERPQAFKLSVQKVELPLTNYDQ